MLDVIQLVMLTVIMGLMAARSSGFQFKRHGLTTAIDSCGLIDGRILDLVRNNLLPGRLIVPAFVLRELQLLADGSDAHKRERARHGLDTAHQLQALATDRFNQSAYLSDDSRPVDEKLLLLAETYRARLYTTDTALEDLARLRHIPTININSLAQSLRPAILPGEAFTIALLQKGNGRGQAVGYTEDGTMVVVDDGVPYIGKTVEVVCDRMHQTVAGKMLFASLVRTPTKDSLRQRIKNR